MGRGSDFSSGSRVIELSESVCKVRGRCRWEGDGDCRVYKSEVYTDTRTHRHKINMMGTDNNRCLCFMKFRLFRSDG